jgi:hypothetical protein
MQCINKQILVSFVTTCVNEFEQLKETYYKNVTAYKIYNNVEFILINFGENENDNVTEYLTTNLYNEIKTGKLKYYKRSMPLNKFNIASLKNVAFTLADGKYVYNLDCDNYLDGNECMHLEKSIELYGVNIVIHQNDGPSQILHSMWKDFNLCNNCHNNNLIWNKTTGRICFNKKTFIDIGGYNENEIFNKIDSNVNLLLRLINLNTKYIHVNLSFKSSHVDSKFNKIYSFDIDLIIKNIYFEKNKKVMFGENINDYTLFDISEFKILTCFSVLYKCDFFIDNLLTDILSQTIFNNVSFKLINLPYTNNANTNNKINELKKYNNITIIDETYDYGLYNMWNKCIEMSDTYLVSNMNPDDVRGPNWAYHQIINFEPNVALVAPKYTPIKKLVNHRFLSIANPLTIWVNKKYIIDDNNNVSVKPINTYFTSKDMFQYNADYTFQSNNICNCSPIWRKNIIHNDDNYFDEYKYGCYADFVVWLNAGSKEYVYKQTNYLVGFYIDENQLHKRLTNDLNVLKELILKYQPNILQYQEKNINKIKANYVINDIDKMLWKNQESEIWQKSDCKICKIIFGTNELIYINNDDLWQKPVITELIIIDNLVKMRNIPYNYIAFPWANYIDNKWSHNNDILERIIESEINSPSIIDFNKTYFTVIQHIEFRNYIEILVKLNIKYIFTPHKIQDDYILENKYNVHIIPISLYPKQYNKYANKSLFRNYEKKYLASFIGQIIHKNMISNIRQEIYNVFKDKSDCLIKANAQWYYENNVYGQKQNEIISEDFFYKNNLFESKFTLCPSGTGPNSIRLWEALSFGCIPVILSDSLILPNIPNVDYSTFCIFWKENNIDKLYDYLKSIDDEEITKMSKIGINMFIKYFSEYKIQYQILYYFDNISSQEKKNQLINKTEIPFDIPDKYTIPRNDIPAEYVIINNNNNNNKEKSLLELNTNYVTEKSLLELNTNYVTEKSLLELNTNYVTEKSLLELNINYVTEKSLLELNTTCVTENSLLEINTKLVTEKSLLEINTKLVTEKSLLEINTNDIKSQLLSDINNQRAFIIKAIYGIGNKLRAIASAYSITKNSKFNLYILWEPDFHCECNFSDLFENNYNVINSSCLLSITDDVFDTYNYIEKPYEYINTDTLKNIYVESNCKLSHKDNNLYFKDFLHSLLPIKLIKDIIYGYDYSECIGMHIRVNAGEDYQTDKSEDGNNWSEKERDLMYKYRNMSCLDNFISQINYELYLNPNAVFYIATDLELNYQKLINIYGYDKIKFTKRNNFDRSLDQLYYAIVDIYILSNCKKFYGSYWSSFTELVTYFQKNNNIENILSDNFIKHKLPNISVSQPCKNREINLVNSINSYIYNDIIDDIVIVDFNSDNNLKEYLEKHIDKKYFYKINIIEITTDVQYLASIANNIGLYFSKNEIILKLDADTVINNSFEFFEKYFSYDFEKNIVHFDWTKADNENQKHLNGSFFTTKTNLKNIGYHNQNCLFYGWEDSDIKINHALNKEHVYIENKYFFHTENENTITNSNKIIKNNINFFGFDYKNIVNNYPLILYNKTLLNTDNNITKEIDVVKLIKEISVFNKYCKINLDLNTLKCYETNLDYLSTNIYSTCRFDIFQKMCEITGNVLWLSSVSYHNYFNYFINKYNITNISNKIRLFNILFFDNNCNNNIIQQNNLVITLYNEVKIERCLELLFCLKKNCLNDYISTVNILYENPDKNNFLYDIIIKIIDTESFNFHKKIKIINVIQRPTYNELFDYCNKNIIGTSIIANSDIIYDITLNKLIHLKNDELISLSRYNKYDNEFKIIYLKDFGNKVNIFSQDSCIFISPMKYNIDSFMFLGTMFCDSFLNYKLKESNYKCYNLYEEIITYHIQNDLSLSEIINKDQKKIDREWMKVYDKINRSTKNFIYGLRKNTIEDFISKLNYNNFTGWEEFINSNNEDCV